MRAIHRIQRESPEWDAIFSSMLLILKQEYGVPPLPATSECPRATRRQIANLLSYVTQLQVSTLTDDGSESSQSKRMRETLTYQILENSTFEIGGFSGGLP